MATQYRQPPMPQPAQQQDPYAAFADAPEPQQVAPQQDPYASFQDAPPVRQDQALGFQQGFLSPFARLEAGVEKGLDAAWDALPIPEGGIPGWIDRNLKPSSVNAFFKIGGKSAAENEDALKGYFADKAAQGIEPGVPGKIAGGMAASLPIMMATKNPWLGGAAGGAFLSEGDTPKEVAFDTAIGALGGKLADVGFQKLANAVSPIINPAVRKLADEGVKLTPGMVRGGRAMVAEDKAMSRPVIGDLIREGRERAGESFNVATINQALKPLGVAVPDRMPSGHDAVAFAQNAIDDAYEAVAPKLRAIPDEKFTAGLAKIGQDLQMYPAEVQSAFQNATKNMFGPNGSLVGRPVKVTQSNLGRMASNMRSSADAYQRELGGALTALKGEFDDLVERSSPKEIAKALRSANKAFRGVAIVEDAASRGAEGAFSPNQLAQAVRRADSTRRKGATAAGKAFMQEWSDAAKAVLPAKTPNSGTADRQNANLLQAIINAVPAVRYQIDQALVPLKTAPRPAGVDAIANALRKFGPRTAPAPSAVRKGLRE